MSNEAKIRDLINKHPEDEKVVLMDIVNELIDLQIPLGKLEVFNYKESVTEVVKGLSVVEEKVKLFKHRIRNEVRTEVLDWHNNKPKQKRNMNPKSLANLKKKKN